MVNDALLLLSSIFTYNPIESMEAETVRSCWMAVLYVFDTILCTYNTAEQHVYREEPPVYAEGVSVPRDQPSRSEEEERVVVETLRIVCFLHSIFFTAVPIVEELIFRAVVYERIRRYCSVTAAALWTSFFFGVYHGNMSQGIYAFLLSLLMVYMKEKYHTMAAPVGGRCRRRNTPQQWQAVQSHQPTASWQTRRVSYVQAVSG